MTASTTHTPILRYTDARDNADLMVMCRDLGYLPSDQQSYDLFVLDCTYGSGRFWRKWRPNKLIRADIDVIDEAGNTREGVVQSDFTDMPWGSNTMKTVVFDPPYKLNGTPSQGGPANSDKSYGVGKYQSPANRMKLILAGADESYRVCAPGGHVLIKCQDQVSSGKMHWQTIDVTNHMRDQDDCELVDMLHLPSYRAQPRGRQQVHAHQNYSTLLVFQKPLR